MGDRKWDYAAKGDSHAYALNKLQVADSEIRMNKFSGGNIRCVASKQKKSTYK